MKRLTIRLDDALHRRLRFMSLDTEEPLQQLAERLLREELERYQRAKKPKGR